MAIAKRDLLVSLNQVIPEGSPHKTMIIQSVNQMIPGSDSPSSAVRRTYKLYQKFHPENGNMEPTLDDVLGWLKSRAAIPYIGTLEKRLQRIEELLEKIGQIEPGTEASVPYDVILSLRLVASQPLKGVDEAEEISVE